MWDLFSVPLPEFVRTTTFRWALTVSSAFLVCTLVLFGFVYWQTAVYVMSKYDVLLVEEVRVFASNTPDQMLQEIHDRLLKDPQRIKIAGLFDADGSRIAGNIESLPPGRGPDAPTNTMVVRFDSCPCSKAYPVWESVWRSRLTTFD